MTKLSDSPRVVGAMDGKTVDVLIAFIKAIGLSPGEGVIAMTIAIWRLMEANGISREEGATELSRLFMSVEAVEAPPPGALQ